MFVRIKSTPNSPRKSVQIVASVRKGNKVSQKIIRHIGVAFDDEELEQLKLLAESIKEKLQLNGQISLFPPEKVYSKNKKAVNNKYKRSDYNVNLKDLEEEQRLVCGIHDVYGALFDDFGYARVFNNPARQKSLVDIFKNVVMARIANPVSKRASVDMLEEDFGICLDLHRVYRMMDKLDDKAIERLNDITYQKTLDIFAGKLDVVFIDATTVYFESFEPDDLKDMGYSKDLKFNQPQVLLSLLVTKEGLPIAYKLFPGNTYEGHTLIPALMQLRHKYNIDKVIMVADSGLFNKNNISALEDNGFEYVVGARLRNMSKSVQRQILDKDGYKKIGRGYFVKEIDLANGQRLIVSYKTSRARKDAFERDKAIRKLERKLSKKKNVRNYLSNYGYKKYLMLDSESNIAIDRKKVINDSQWDGLHGIITNSKQLSSESALSQYNELWQVENAFRITKHTLKVRPVFHWTASRIRAHFAICFCAYSLVKHLAYRVKLQYKNLSVEYIRNRLVKTQVSILFDKKRNMRYALPSKIHTDVKKIYSLLNVRAKLSPYIIEKM